MFAPALSQHVFFAQFQHREPADFPKIMGDTGFDHHVSISSRQPTNDLVRLVSKQNYQLRTSLSIWFRNTIIFERSDYASTQNGGTPGASRPTCSSRGLWRTQPRPMDGAGSVRSSGARYRYARCRSRSRNARRPAPSADYRGCERSASTLWCLPRLRVPRRDLPQFNKHETLGP